MQNVTTEQTLRNAVASAEMEGYKFLPQEIDNVRKCLDGKITREEFLKTIKDNLKRS